LYISLLLLKIEYILPYDKKSSIFELVSNGGSCYPAKKEAKSMGDLNKDIAEHYIFNGFYKNLTSDRLQYCSLIYS
jgi:hypothetical protein